MFLTYTQTVEDSAAVSERGERVNDSKGLERSLKIPHLSDST